MLMHHWRIALVALSICLALAAASAAEAVVIATSKGAGADAEVRDHQPTTNFGASTELATRIVDNFPFGSSSDGNDRFSAMYMKFDITGQTALPSQTTTVRLTYRNTNFTLNRIADTTPPGSNTDFRTGLAFYGLDRDDPGNNWSEPTINYITAPGLAGGGDSNNGTKDFDFVDPDGAGPLRAPLTPLGVALFPELGLQNRLPVGGELRFSNTALNNFVTTSLNAGKTCDHRGKRGS
jgi:opacity protein-like surface antigen